jgi:hypothetical protein
VVAEPRRMVESRGYLSSRRISFTTGSVKKEAICNRRSASSTQV